MNHSTIAVIGAGRGLGRGAAEAFARTEATVLAVARTESDLLALEGPSGRIVPLPRDALDPSVAEEIVTAHRPDVVVLVAGVTPAVGPFDEQSWDDFSLAWELDVKLTQLWLTQILRTPLRPGSRVIVISSGAAVGGSPLSGGYAGAKATQRFLTVYAQEEAKLRGLDLTFTAVLPRITPLTSVGAAATRAYAERYGLSEAEYVAQFGEALTPQLFGDALRSLADMVAEEAQGSFLLTAAGLQRLP